MGREKTERGALASLPARVTLQYLQSIRRASRADDSYNVRDDLDQIRLVGQLGLDLGEWADSRGLPRKYAEALRRYLVQQRSWDPPEDHF